MVLRLGLGAKAEATQRRFTQEGAVAEQKEPKTPGIDALYRKGTGAPNGAASKTDASSRTRHPSVAPPPPEASHEDWLSSDHDDWDDPITSW